MNNPTCHFYDTKSDMNLINKAETNLKLEDIITMWDKHCACDITHPFGCTNHLLSCKSMSYSDVLKKFIYHKDISVFDYKKIQEHYPAHEGLHSQMKSPRSDYLNLEDKLFNKLVIRSSLIVSEDNWLCVLTCEKHEGGYSKKIIHPPCNPINKFPLAMSYQLEHAVVCPRVLKPMKINEYSKTYQIHEIRGNFTVLDSCDLL